ncbi:uncharacterized protein TNCV_1754941 [Trichonephila clavipes]|nr:uncharacterized protein TNCV_1754941 [Trichonephila clavipes]
MHGQCPLGSESWCAYQRAQSAGKVFYDKNAGLPKNIINKIKPTYLQLCDQNLFRKCLHGKTQNANEGIQRMSVERGTHPVFDPSGALGTTQGLAIFSDSRAALEAIIKGDTNITSAINVLIENANAVANYRLLPHRHKILIVDFDCSRNLTSIIARLRTGHFKGMKISSDKTRTYIPCKNCTKAQLTPDHMLECPPFTPLIIRLGMVPLASELREILYSADAPRHAEAVPRAHDIISYTI